MAKKIINRDWILTPTIREQYDEPPTKHELLLNVLTTGKTITSDVVGPLKDILQSIGFDKRDPICIEFYRQIKSNTLEATISYKPHLQWKATQVSNKKITANKGSFNLAFEFDNLIPGNNEFLKYMKPQNAIPVGKQTFAAEPFHNKFEKLLTKCIKHLCGEWIENGLKIAVKVHKPAKVDMNTSTVELMATVSFSFK
jgi:hypothetical protein